MFVIADITFLPIQYPKDKPTSDYIKACLKTFDRYSLISNVHAQGTNVEGEFDEIMKAVKDCFAVIQNMGCENIASFIQLTFAANKDLSIQSRLSKVKE
ncbi:hypothetical protein O9G_002746 [Rozella allomycis CSF55]|uniref:Thiamine-binding protein domain-containing protein n=1 Tax=Rozella allomycis (strain CSF55) TaxID=988480 RepID=A0A075AWR1_ROZAC|nr:hypothetical protein O9G_002746 [Rozella allomycis CSF55]|eukprot:EPZ34682.1 hypothetical protein O9G_002746 [Rozella allomycis CSF55]